MKTHKEHQVDIINQIEEQVQKNELQFTTVAPVADYFNDPRMCLTSVHFPQSSLVSTVEQIIRSLQEVEPSYFYYPKKSLHMTVKNIHCISDPPRFTEHDVATAGTIFSKVIPTHTAYNIYFYRLLIFKTSVSLIGTTDPELDTLVLDLDRKLVAADLPDDKVYTNKKYFFCNMTLARFPKASQAFIQKVEEISQELDIQPYIVEDISLVTGNAALTKLNVINTWKLRNR